MHKAVDKTVIYEIIPAHICAIRLIAVDKVSKGHFRDLYDLYIMTTHIGNS